MSSPSTPKIIIKRRPSHAEASAELPPSNDDHIPYDEEPVPRGTIPPNAAESYQPYEPAPQPSSEPRADGEAVTPDGGYHNDDIQFVIDDDDSAPPDGMKTARPKDPKEKKTKAKKEKKATKKDQKKPKKSVKPAAAGEQQQQQQPANGAAAARPSPTPASAAASKKKRRPARKVSILNVEKVEPVPEGVNTPRSVALCNEHGITTSELRPRPLEDFKGPHINHELAELRYNSYERRRQAHMATLMPARLQLEEEEKEEREEAQDAAAEHPEGEEQQPGGLDEETLEMQRQFEEQHSRILEQERRQAGQTSSVRRGNSPHSGGRAPSHSGTSPRAFSHASATRNSNSIIGLPASATKIQSRCKVENRQLNEAERVAMEEILERELYQQEIRERQAILEDNRKLMLIEQRLAKEKAAAQRVQRIKKDRERKAEKKFVELEERDTITFNRRAQIEEERQRKIEDDLAEKEARVHANDPYTSVLSRRRYSTARGDRRDSSARGERPENSSRRVSAAEAEEQSED